MKSKQVDLEMPDDVFHLTKHGIKFIDMESYQMNRQK
ncbi:MAG: DUF4857 domain-containing protein [Bacteroidales bacterium]